MPSESFRRIPSKSSIPGKLLASIDPFHLKVLLEHLPVIVSEMPLEFSLEFPLVDFPEVFPRIPVEKFPLVSSEIPA